MAVTSVTRRVLAAIVAPVVLIGCSHGTVRPAGAPEGAAPAATRAAVDAPTRAPATRPSFGDAATVVLKAVLSRNERDPALAPATPQAVAGDGGDVSAAWLDYATRDEWPDLPSKFPPGRTAGRGRVSVWLGRAGEPPPPGFTPFAPPKGCYYQRTVWTASGPVGGVVVYSMTADPAAHDRLLATVRDELANENITARPVTERP